MQYIIRGANLCDYNGLCRILKDLDSLHSRALPEIFREYEGDARPMEYMQAMMDSESSRIFVAETGEKIIGAVHVYIRETPDINVLAHRAYGIIDDLVVCDNMQGQGIGKALMANCRDWLKGRGITSVELNVWEFNEHAMKFYESLGYKTLSRRMGMEI